MVGKRGWVTSVVRPGAMSARSLIVGSSAHLFLNLQLTANPFTSPDLYPLITTTIVSAFRSVTRTAIGAFVNFCLLSPPTLTCALSCSRPSFERALETAPNGKAGYPTAVLELVLGS